jgi:signal transduction histidine kinase
MGAFDQARSHGAHYARLLIDCCGCARHTRRMAQRFRAARARASRRPSSRQAGDAGELIHDLHNSLAAMSLWLDTLLEQPCPQCRGARDEVAAGIRRNIAGMLAASQRLIGSSKDARRAARSGARETAPR